MKRYLKEWLVVAAGVLMAANVNAQCVFNSQFGTTTLGDFGETVTATTCAFAGEYSVFNAAVAGTTYEFEGIGGSGNYITLTDAANNVLQHGPSPQILVSPLNGAIRAHFATSAACGTEISCRSARATTLLSGVGSEGLALFRVSKTFTDGNPSEVEVSLSCNTGLILDQSKIITADEQVTFVMTEFDSGEMNCEITETPVPGYDVLYADGSGTNSTSCEYLDIEEGDFYICNITNTPAPVDIEITKNWVFEGSTGPQDIDTYYELTLWCDAEIVGGYWLNGDNLEAPAGVGPGCSLMNPTLESPQGYYWADWCQTFWGDGPDVFDVQVIPEYPDSNCFVVEKVYDNAVEVDNGCTNLTVSAGQGAACTVTNTVFFEGIPTLSQYSMAILALLMLGIGVIGFRRFA